MLSTLNVTILLTLIMYLYYRLMARHQLKRALPPLGLAVVGLLTGACSALPLSISMAGPSVASNSGSALSSAPTATPFPLAYGRLGHVLTSDNWTGYVISNTLPAQTLNRRRVVRPAVNGGTVSDVQAQWTVPTLSCGPAATFSALWVGIDGETDGTVEQVGTGADCSRGAPIYYAWFEIFPRPSQDLSQFQVSPGDSVLAEVSYKGSGQFDLTLQDLSSHQTFHVSRSNARALRQSAEWVAEAPATQNNQVLPLAAFSTVSFSKAQATINGQTCTPNSCVWPVAVLVMQSPGGKIKAYPSQLSADGGSFAVTWRAS